MYSRTYGLHLHVGQYRFKRKEEEVTWKDNLVKILKWIAMVATGLAGFLAGLQF